MIEHDRSIVGLGELLWDLLPGGKQLGGAAANFAVMAARLGNDAAIASAVGKDSLGEEARSRLAQLPVGTEYLQADGAHPTGSVSVTLRDGQPEYVIHEPVAWDFLVFHPEWESLAAHADAVCFNTLAQRNVQSRETIRAFLQATPEACLRVLDVNLRAPFYNAEVLDDSLSLATVVKLNDEELPIVLRLIGLSNTASATEPFLTGAQALLDRYANLELVCVTMGGRGSLLVTRQEHHSHSGISVTVADTVGAGDAFTAALVHYRLRGASLATLNEAGNRWGSWVASQHGAMPSLPDAVFKQITAHIATIG